MAFAAFRPLSRAAKITRIVATPACVSLTGSSLLRDGQPPPCMSLLDALHSMLSPERYRDPSKFQTLLTGFFHDKVAWKSAVGPYTLRRRADLVPRPLFLSSTFWLNRNHDNLS